MRNYPSLCAVLLVIISIYNSYGQCNSTILVENLPLSNSCIPVVSELLVAGEFTNFTGPLANKTYEFSSTIPSDYITVRDTVANTVLVHGTGTLTYSTGAVAPGRFKVIVNSNASCGTNGIIRDLIVRCASCSPLAFPTCVSNFAPANNAFDLSLSPQLSWDFDANAYSYDIYMAVMTGGCPGTPGTYVLKANFIGTTIGVVTGLAYGTTYRWYAVPKACDDTPASGCLSNATCFTTLQLPPVNDSCQNAILISPNLNCTWTDGTARGARDENLGGECTSATIRRTVWYKFVPGASSIKIGVQGSAAFDAVIKVTSNCSNGSVIGGSCVNATGPGQIEVLNLSGLSSSATYFISIYDYFGDTSVNATFQVCASTNTPLPIRLSSFNAIADGESNHLSWTTETEESSYKFQVERHSSLDRDWTTIKELDAAGQSSKPVQYSMEDEAPPAIAYYRLKMLDQNGEFTYSSTLRVARKGKSVWTQVSPNPFHSNLNISIDIPDNQMIQVSISDMQGRQLDMYTYDFAKGTYPLEIDSDAWPVGLYILQVRSTGGTEVMKVLKD
ncbi:MAG: T9SS type A sorting domain-containing protein [Saprospiraceae bacterium]